MDGRTTELLDGTRRIVEWRLHILRLAIEMGLARTASSFIHKWGPELAATDASPTRREEYAWLIGKTGRMIEIEKVHGEGCLLELDHPFVVSLSTCKKPSIQAHEIDAARRYRSISRDDVDSAA